MAAIRSNLGYVDYGDPKNRPYRIPIDGTVKGYTFNRMQKWVDKWDDNLCSIRRDPRYRINYTKHYQFLLTCIGDKQSRERGVKYLVDGLRDCIDMFEKIQNGMSPDEEFYIPFVWESKVMFFSYFDFCKPKEKPNQEISEVEKTLKELNVDKNFKKL